MRTIALEEHFLADGFRKVMERNASRSGKMQGSFPAALQVKLEDLGLARLRDMDAAQIDCQVLSHTVMGIDFIASQRSRSSLGTWAKCFLLCLIVSTTSLLLW
jgi:hypothetical protein